MLAKVFSGANVGLEGVLVTVEVDVSSRGLPSFTIVGLPTKAVQEAKERVKAAIKNSSGEFPGHRVVVNLAPADLPKEGPAYDLPMAVGLLVASGQLEPLPEKVLFLGELSLDGTVSPTKGVLPMTLLAKKQGFKSIFLPLTNAKEAAVVKGIKVYPVASLRQLSAHFSGGETIKPQPHVDPRQLVGERQEAEFDMAEIKGQEHAKRALEIAAAGGHNVLMRGVPGAGKTMLARALPGILPDLNEEETLEVAKIYSIAGLLSSGKSIVKYRPFRSPHHITSRIGLIGGGSHPKPGEISLAHRGVLFLDEFPEFPRHVLEALRQPIEDGVVSISRASGTVTYPAKFILVAAANPCPCGYLGSPKKECRCLPGQIIRYQRKISGPIIDRIDLHVEVPAVDVEKLTTENIVAESSLSIRSRIQKAREIQRQRFKGTRIKANGEMGTKEVKKFCQLPQECLSLLRQAISQFNLSARGYHKVIKIARTIADLSGEAEVKVEGIAEALQYRPKLREF